jgi:hypothetical protein
MKVAAYRFILHFHKSTSFQDTSSNIKSMLSLLQDFHVSGHRFYYDL